MRKALLIVLLLVLCSFSAALGQNNKVFSIFTHYGKVITTNSFLKGENKLNCPINIFKDFSIRYEIQTNGSKPWHSFYDYPSFGIGIDVIDFSDKGLLKTPVAAYSFLSMSYWKNKKFDLRGEFSLGIAGNWNYFDEKNNIENTAIGSALTCYFDYGFHLYYKVVPNIDMSLGISMTHFSNGALKKPNRGINIISPRLAVKGTLKNYKEKINLSNESQYFDTINTFSFSCPVFVGIFGDYYRAYNYGINDSLYRKQFIVFGISPTIHYNFNIKHSVGLGFDAAYFDMAGKYLAVENGEIVLCYESNWKKRFNAGVFISYEWRMFNFILTVEPCLYLYKHDVKIEYSFFYVPIFYQRIGFQYLFSKNFFAGLKLRAYRFSIAHFIEWNLGIRL
ncbi:MAG: acyloxyacyl hydrolase [Bacteroidales bacterium]|jgi:hypothetical protein|nr:acyloxyacyl hydrolase [Bacteroidales bacterium]